MNIGAVSLFVVYSTFNHPPCKSFRPQTLLWPEVSWATEELPSTIRGTVCDDTSALTWLRSSSVWGRGLLGNPQRDESRAECRCSHVCLGQILVSYLPGELWCYLDWPFPLQVTGCGSAGVRGGGSVIRPDRNCRVWCSLSRCHTHQTVRRRHRVRRSSRKLRDWRWRVTQSFTSPVSPLPLWPLGLFTPCVWGCGPGRCGDTGYKLALQGHVFLMGTLVTWRHVLRF